MEIALDNIRQAEGILDELNGLKENIENRINLSQVAGNEKRVLLTGNKIMRICLIAGLNVAEKRSMERINNIQLSKSSIRIPSSFFTHNNLRSLYSALLKIRYRDFKIDWNDNPTVSRSIDLKCANFCANTLIGAISKSNKAIFFNIILLFLFVINLFPFFICCLS